uniref:Uncharacterized protein n=1 Tax=Aegilops tauschii subsp. strangulata TaxID=200361 RepID=A0A452Z215_AEGTS
MIISLFSPSVYMLLLVTLLRFTQMLSGNMGMMLERNNIDPFDEPECEARDIFVNELLCIGTGCPYSCVKRAPHAFAFADDIGTARAISQGVMVTITLSNLLLGSVRESAYTM